MRQLSCKIMFSNLLTFYLNTNTYQLMWIKLKPKIDQLPIGEWSWYSWQSGRFCDLEHLTLRVTIGREDWAAAALLIFFVKYIYCSSHKTFTEWVYTIFYMVIVHINNCILYTTYWLIAMLRYNSSTAVNSLLLFLFVLLLASHAGHSEELYL